MRHARAIKAGVAQLVAAFLLQGVAAAQEAVYVVRHAERADSTADSELSADGVERSKALSKHLAAAGITRIFATERKRTVQTAAPLADTLKATTTIVQAADEAALVAKVRESKRTDRVLIVGHSNTVPSILRRLGVTETITIPDNEFDNLFIVVPNPGGSTVLLRLKY
jgi:broad specificity phosphatase PhoE